MLDFRYDDEGAWPGRADGSGSSLEAIDLGSDYGDLKTGDPAANTAGRLASPARGRAATSW